MSYQVCNFSAQNNSDRLIMGLRCINGQLCFIYGENLFAYTNLDISIVGSLDAVQIAVLKKYANKP